MEDFKKRLIDEKNQLDERKEKLNNFLKSERIKDIDDVQLSLLRIQFYSMETYSQCLFERLNRL